MLRLFTSLALLVALPSCAGYRLGGAVPEHLENVKTIAVPQFQNKTLSPRLSVLATNSTVDAMLQDGTYQVASAAQADAKLIGSIEAINYQQYSASRTDSLASDELTMEIIVHWKLLGANGVKLEKGIAKGRTNFFIDANQQTSRSNAMPLAAERVGQRIIQSISEGF